MVDVVDFLKGKAGTSSANSEQNAILKQLGLVATSCEASSSSKDEKVDNHQDTEKREEVDNKPQDPFLPSERPQQQNKKKCWVCKCKLELAQRELGSCKCGKFLYAMYITYIHAGRGLVDTVCSEVHIHVYAGGGLIVF